MAFSKLFPNLLREILYTTGICAESCVLLFLACHCLHSITPYRGCERLWLQCLFAIQRRAYNTGFHCTPLAVMLMNWL
jgi:hypothetical protein